MAEVRVLLGKTVNQVLRGEIDPRVANACGYLISVLVRAIEGSELAQRIAALEERAATQAEEASAYHGNGRFRR
jgi:hypothetical protein